MTHLNEPSPPVGRYPFEPITKGDLADLDKEIVSVTTYNGLRMVLVAHRFQRTTVSSPLMGGDAAPFAQRFLELSAECRPSEVSRPDSSSPDIHLQSAGVDRVGDFFVCAGREFFERHAVQTTGDAVLCP